MFANIVNHLAWKSCAALRCQRLDLRREAFEPAAELGFDPRSLRRALELMLAVELVVIRRLLPVDLRPASDRALELVGFDDAVAVVITRVQELLRELRHRVLALEVLHEERVRLGVVAQPPSQLVVFAQHRREFWVKHVVGEAIGQSNVVPVKC